MHCCKYNIFNDRPYAKNPKMIIYSKNIKKIEDVRKLRLIFGGIINYFLGGGVIHRCSQEWCSFSIPEIALNVDMIFGYTWQLFSYFHVCVQTEFSSSLCYEERNRFGKNLYLTAQK